MRLFETDICFDSDLWERLRTCDRPVVLYGTGDGAEKIAAQLTLRGISVSGVFASDGFVRPGKTFMGLPVTDFASAKARFGDMTVLVCFGSDRPDVIGSIRRIAAEQDLYVPDVPVAGQEIFDAGFALDHRAELEEAYSLLADEQSRHVFRSLIRYKLSGRPEYLYSCESDEAEMWSLIGINDKEDYVDLGAYTGDTIEDFLRHTEGYSSITAFEPDRRNYRKLESFAAGRGLASCMLVNAAAGAVRGEIDVAANSGRGSSVFEACTEETSGAVPSAGGARRKSVKVPVLPVDDVLAGRRASIIKIDVEGQERAAIEGCRQTIERCRPRIIAAAYHRSADLYAVPAQLLSICPDYRIFLRHSPCLPAWEVNYIFI